MGSDASANPPLLRGRTRLQTARGLVPCPTRRMVVIGADFAQLPSDPVLRVALSLRGSLLLSRRAMLLTCSEWMRILQSSEELWHAISLEEAPGAGGILSLLPNLSFPGRTLALGEVCRAYMAAPRLRAASYRPRRPTHAGTAGGFFIITIEILYHGRIIFIKSVYHWDFKNNVDRVASIRVWDSIPDALRPIANDLDLHAPFLSIRMFATRQVDPSALPQTMLIFEVKSQSRALRDDTTSQVAHALEFEAWQVAFDNHDDRPPFGCINSIRLVECMKHGDEHWMSMLTIGLKCAPVLDLASGLLWRPITYTEGANEYPASTFCFKTYIENCVPWPPA